jgi:hypothetical protein
VGERFHIRKAREESLVVGDHGFDARLLEHDLGDPDPVEAGARVRLRLSPGQVAFRAIVPGEQGTAK